MVVKSIRTILFLLITVVLASCGSYPASNQIQPLADGANRQINAVNAPIGPLYEQPVDPVGKLYLSAWIDPDGTDFDQKIWDDFTLQSNETITEIDWIGGYDPLKNGMGGPVLDFTVAIYPSIAAGTEPAVAGLPLVTYQTGGNAGEISIGTVGGTPMYAYAFNLPATFSVSAGVKYWVHIVASQGGSSPDWGLAAGTGGNSSHYRWGAGVGGDSGFRPVPGDAAFTLLGPVPDIPTPTDTPTDTATSTATDTPVNPPTDTATSTATSTNTPTNTATNTATATNTPTNTATSTATATNTPTNTATSTATATNTPTNTATSTATATNTPTNTATSTATSTNMPISTATNTPTNTPTSTPLPNTPGKVTGGGNINVSGGKATFGFVVQSSGAAIPSGNLTFNDHGANISLKATSFRLLNIQGNHAVITGYAIVNGQTGVAFILTADDFGEPGASDKFMIQIPAWNGYYAGGVITGGNIQVTTP